MLRIITAATALAVLVACDSEGIDRAGDTSQSTASATLQNDTTDTDTTASADANGTDTGTTETTGDESPTGPVASSNTGGSETGGDNNGDNNGTGGNPDGGSSTSDGGQSGNENNTEGGSATSDGGLLSDDGTVADAADANSSEPAPATAAPAPDAGEFATDTGNGNTVRVSTLVAEASEQLCTTLANPDDFSNIFIGDFILHNNAWRTFRAPEGFAWEQCIFTNTNGAVVGWNYDWGPGNTGINGNPNPSGDFFVRSYPELIYGIKDEFRTSAPKSVTGLPVGITEMPTFQIDYAFDAPQFGEARTVDASNNSRFPNGSTISGERNVAVESFFYQRDAAGQCSEDIVTRTGGSNHAYEVMVWLDAGAERLPAGPNDFVADVSIRNQPYKVYTKDSDDRYIAFVAQSPQSTGSIIMNDFIDWARANAHQVSSLFGANSDSVQIQDSWCMANILVGTEIFWGAGSMNITEWTITQSQ